MHTFRQTTSGRYEVGHFVNYTDCWKTLFRVDDIETAMRAVRYLNGGDIGALGFKIYEDKGREGPITVSMSR